MSEENVELVRRGYDAWSERGPESFEQFLAEDGEFHDPPNLPDSRVVRGRDAVVAYQIGEAGEAAQVIEVADGRIQRFRMFLTWEEALEAAGLEE